jgi:hypothetical protein
MRDGPFLGVVAVNAVLYLHDGLLTVALPIWLTRQVRAPSSLVSLLLIVNTIGVILLQVRFAGGAGSIRGAATAGKRGGLSLATACALLAISFFAGPQTGIMLVLVASLLHLFGELWQSASSWAFGFEMTDDKHLGQYQGILNAGMDIGSVLSPAILIAVASSESPYGWIILSAIFSAASALYSPLSSLAIRTRPNR